MTNRQKFEQALEGAFITLYCFPQYSVVARKQTPKEGARQWMSAWPDAHETGEGVKSACRVCGIKNTRTAIQGFFEADRFLQGNDAQ